MKSKIAGWVMASVLISGLMGPAMAADTIKIGFHAPLTGFAASDGKSATEGAKLAVEQINAAGGVLGKQLELVVYDDQAKPAQAIPIANKLIGQDKVVVGISGSYSGADPLCSRRISGSQNSLYLCLRHPPGHYPGR